MFLTKIAVGCTVKRLTSNCASLHTPESIPQLLALHQLGFGIAGGVEAAVHASRMYLNNLPPTSRVKVDFKNAFNSICQDKMAFSSSILAPSAFLASTGGASDLMQQLLPDHLSSTPYPDRNLALHTWKHAVPKDTPTPLPQIKGTLGTSQ